MKNRNKKCIKTSGGFCFPATLLFVLVVSGLATGDIIIDNSEIATSHTGIWQISAGANYYGDDSLWSRDGATYTWMFDSPLSDAYEVLMWWTEWPSRSKCIPVDIEWADEISTVYINQQQNGGRWNSLGEYFFESGANYHITITARPGPSSTNADAVWFRPTAVPEPTTLMLLAFGCVVLRLRKKR